MYDGNVIIYADILFLINFSLDYLGLFITSRLLNQKTNYKRLLLSGISGSVYSFIPYFINFDTPLNFLMHTAMAIIMIFIAFGIKPLKTTLLSLLTFMVSSALLGGLITALYNMTGNYHNGIYREIKPNSFLVICIISVAITLCYGFISRKKINVSDIEIRVLHNGTKFDLRLIVDSGNLITEPFSALPVIIAVSNALPFPFDDPERENFPCSIRAIPFSTASGKGCFFGFKPEKIQIAEIGKKPKTIDAYIAVDKQNTAYSGYDGIIPASLI